MAKNSFEFSVDVMESLNEFSGYPNRKRCDFGLFLGLIIHFPLGKDDGS